MQLPLCGKKGEELTVLEWMGLMDKRSVPEEVGHIQYQLSVFGEVLGKDSAPFDLGPP